MVYLVIRLLSEKVISSGTNNTFFQHVTHCAVFYCVRSQLVFSCTIAGDFLHSSFSVFFGLFRRGGRLAAQFERVLIQKIDDFEHDEMPLRRPQSAFCARCYRVVLRSRCG